MVGQRDAVAAADLRIRAHRGVHREVRKRHFAYPTTAAWPACRTSRRQQAQLEGLGRRALAAHHNGFEAFAPFAIAVLAALQRGVAAERVGAIALGFAVVRLGYVVAYLTDRATLRSALWGLGMTATGVLLVLAILG